MASTSKTTTTNTDALDLISIKRAAELLGVSEHVTRQLVKTNKLPSCRVGYFVRVRESDVRAFVDRQLAT